jgi:hypothetical protein
MSFAIVRGYLLWSLGPWGKQYNDMLDLMHFDPLLIIDIIVEDLATPHPLILLRPLPPTPIPDPCLRAESCYYKL